MSKDVWSKGKVCLPISGRDLPGFRAWVYWHGFSKHHEAFDFAAYINEQNNCVLGLPEKTPVRAVADGIVIQVMQEPELGAPYGTYINIEHGEMGCGMFSAYHHVNPLIESGTNVKEGDVIANLYKDKGDEEGRLVHLHFELLNGWNIKPRYVDPVDIFPELKRFKAEPPGKTQFTVKRFKELAGIEIANFKRVKLRS